MAKPAGTQSRAVSTQIADRRRRSTHALMERGLGASRKAFLLVILFSLAINLLMLTIPVYLMQLSDRVLLSGSTDTLLVLTNLAIAAVAALALFEVVRRMILARVASRLETGLGGPLLTAAIRRTAQGASEDTQGLRDLAQVRGFVASPVVPLMVDLPMVPVYILFVVLIHPQLGLITAIGAAVLLMLALANQAATATAQRIAGAHSLSAFAAAQAHTRNAEVIQAMGMLPQCVDAWGRDSAAGLEAQSKANARSAVLTGLSKLARLVLQIAVLGWGAYLALSNEITGGMMIAASIIGSRALAPIEGTIEGWRSFVQARQAYRRIKDLVGFGIDETVPTSLPEPAGEIVVEKLVFTSPDTAKPLIKGITFGIRAGDSVAVVGPTGAGKSTLARILVGALPPSAGVVRLDQADIHHWDRSEFGKYVGYLPQDVELFPGTVAYNIARLKEGVSSEEIIQAAQFAGAHQLITRLPGGYETEIRLGGAPLSGGQRQRVALARAFFGMPKLIVLDEPDANLDRDGEQALVQTLMRAKKRGITTVTITQRPTLLEFVDKILVMKDGKIEAYGPRNVVLGRKDGAPEVESAKEEPGHVTDEGSPEQIASQEDTAAET